MVEQAEGDSKQHVDDPQDDGHLHFEGVEEGELVGSKVPDLQSTHNTAHGSRSKLTTECAMEENWLGERELQH